MVIQHSGHMESPTWSGLGYISITGQGHRQPGPPVYLVGWRGTPTISITCTLTNYPWAKGTSPPAVYWTTLQSKIHLPEILLNLLLNIYIGGPLFLQIKTSSWLRSAHLVHFQPHWHHLLPLIEKTKRITLSLSINLIWINQACSFPA